jgi:YD repeat-containing protein
VFRTKHAVKQRRLARALVSFGAVMAAVAIVSDLAQAAEEARYKYDAQGQVILVTKSDGRQNGYGYDAASNRINLAGGAQVLPTYPDRLLQGQSLLPGKSLQSSNGLYTLVLQDDGNLVQYGPGGGARWQSSTAGKPSARLTMQSDANLVVYGPVGQVYWQTATSGGPGSTLIQQDDGNLVVYSGAGVALWHIYQ